MKVEHTVLMVIGSKAHNLQIDGRTIKNTDEYKHLEVK